MGNCLVGNKVVGQLDEKHEPTKEAVAMEESMETTTRVDDHGEKKKMVRFKLREENGGDNIKGGGVVRIRVVVTQRELQQLLMDYKQDCKFSSVDQLLRAVKMRSRRISDVQGINGSWTPALDSIPEDH